MPGTNPGYLGYEALIFLYFSKRGLIGSEDLVYGNKRAAERAFQHK